MPHYEYECEGCKKYFIVLQDVKCKPEETVCPFCKERKAKKKLSPFSTPGGGKSVCTTERQRSGG